MIINGFIILGLSLPFAHRSKTITRSIEQMFPFFGWSNRPFNQREYSFSNWSSSCTSQFTRVDSCWFCMVVPTNKHSPPRVQNSILSTCSTWLTEQTIFCDTLFNPRNKRTNAPVPARPRFYISVWFTKQILLLPFICISVRFTKQILLLPINLSYNNRINIRYCITSTPDWLLNLMIVDCSNYEVWCSTWGDSPHITETPSSPIDACLKKYSRAIPLS